eukprot:g82274.t1
MLSQSQTLSLQELVPITLAQLLSQPNDVATGSDIFLRGVLATPLQEIRRQKNKIARSKLSDSTKTDQKLRQSSVQENRACRRRWRRRFPGRACTCIAAYKVYAARKKEALRQTPGQRTYYPVTAGYFWADGYEKAMLNNVDPKKKRRPSSTRPPLTAGEAERWFKALKVNTDVLRRGVAFEVPGVNLDAFTKGLDDGLLAKLAPEKKDRAERIQQLQVSLANADFVYCSLAAESLSTEQFRDQYKYFEKIIANPYMTPTTETDDIKLMKAAMARYLSSTVGNGDGGFEVRLFDAGGDNTSPDRHGRDVNVLLALEELFKEGKIKGFKSLQIHVAGAGVDSHTTSTKALENMYQWAKDKGATVTTDDGLGESLCTVLQEAEFAENVRENGRANGNYIEARQIYKQLLKKGKDRSDADLEALKEDYKKNYLLQREDVKRDPNKETVITAEFKAADDLTKVQALFKGLAAYYVIQVPPVKQERVPDAQETPAAVSVSLTV